VSKIPDTPCEPGAVLGAADPDRDLLVVDAVNVLGKCPQYAYAVSGVGAQTRLEVLCPYSGVGSWRGESPAFG
jgi:hypothetical protein